MRQIKKIIAELKKKYKKIKNRDFYRKLNAEKNRMYVRGEQLDFCCRKNKFKFFSLSKKYINFVKIKNNEYIPYYFGVGAFLIFSSVYILLYSSYFSVQKIYIERTDELTNIEIAYKAVKDMYGEPIILLDQRELESKISAFQKNIKTVEIRKMLPDSIKITLSSYKGAFNTKMFGREYIVSNNGIFIPIKNSSKLKYATIHFKDPDTLGIIDYKEVLKKSEIKKINEISTKFSQYINKVKIKDFDYFPVEREIHINDESGTKYIFDLTGNTEEQISKLKALLEKDVSTSKSQVIYYDLRVSGKIFYCDFDNKNDCYINLKKIYNYNLAN